MTFPARGAARKNVSTRVNALLVRRCAILVLRRARDTRIAGRLQE